MFVSDVKLKYCPFYGEHEDVAIAAWNRRAEHLKPSPVGNAAAMREALEEAVICLRNGCDPDSCPTEEEIWDVIKECEAALSASPHEANWTASGGYEFACCSKCGHLQYAGWDSRHEQAEKIGDFHELYKFCPNCGAQMKGETDGSK